MREAPLKLEETGGGSEPEKNIGSVKDVAASAASERRIFIARFTSNGRI